MVHSYWTDWISPNNIVTTSYLQSWIDQLAVVITPPPECDIMQA